MEAFVIGILMIALVGMGILFVRERWAREDERKAFVAQRKELRGWLAERPTRAEADAHRWAACHAAYKAGWNDALAAEAEAEVAEAEERAAAVVTKAKAKAEAKAERLTMK